MPQLPNARAAVLAGRAEGEWAQGRERPKVLTPSCARQKPSGQPLSPYLYAQAFIRVIHRRAIIPPRNIILAVFDMGQAPSCANMPVCAHRTAACSPTSTASPHLRLPPTIAPTPTSRISDTMGFAPEIMRAVKRKGYRLPTPIQRKAMPLIMQVRRMGGRDFTDTDSKAVQALGSGESRRYRL